MRAQPTQATTPSGPGAGANGMATPFHQDPRTPYVSGFQQGSNVPIHENAAPMAQAFPGMNFQHHRGKYAGKGRASVPVNMNANMDWSHANGTPCGNPANFFPNSNFMNGLPQISSFVPNSVSNTMGMYPGLNTMMQGPYSWPYMMNYGQSGMSSVRQSPWTTPDGQKGPQTENNTPNRYFLSTFIPDMNSPALPGFACGNMFPQMGPNPSFPLQMMKTASGYVAQDMEALTQQEPAIPRAVPAMWTNPSDMTLAKCLENREGITNVYIRGFLPETTDEMLHAYAARFGEIERCKAIVDLDTGLCKGFGFVQFYQFSSCENCIRGFFYLGYQASFAQKSRNSRLKELEDKSSTNIYCTNIPIDWTEADLRRHFEPYHVVSEKISRDEETGVSKEVGFARFDTREIAERVLADFHNVTVTHDSVKLLLRFADTKAQKLLKQQSNERRAYRAGEYNFSVEVVQGSTPSPTIRRLRQASAHITPDSQQSFKISPGEISSNWTPATSISPTYALMKKPGNGVLRSSGVQSLSALENTTMYREGFLHRRSVTEVSGSSKTARPDSPSAESYISSPRKEHLRASSMSPLPSRMVLTIPTPQT